MKEEVERLEKKIAFLQECLRREKKMDQEEVEHDRIHQAATDAANQIEREKEERDATERPVAQARINKEGGIEKCCGYIPTLWDRKGNMWVYVCQECGAKQYEGVRQ